MPNSILAILPPQPTFLEPPKRDLTVDLDRAIHLHRARLQFLAHAHGTVDILREDRGTEREFRVVGPVDGFGFGFEGVYDYDGAEDFFFFDGAARFCVCEDGWFDKEALRMS